MRMKLDFDYKIISAQLSVSTVDLSGQVEFSTVTIESNEYEISYKIISAQLSVSTVDLYKWPS